jgi:hypothetical protein
VASDLSSIPGLRPKHETVLTGPLGIKTALDLARSDRRVVHTAMRRLRPAPTLEDIAGWQDHARDLAAAARAEMPEPSGSAGWEQVAAFVVSFESRHVTGGAERRLVVEQVEQAPPEPRQEWPAWSRKAAWTWMLERAAGEDAGQLQPARRERPGHGAAVTDQPAPGPAALAVPEPATKPQPGPAGRAERTRLAGRVVPRPITADTPELVLPAGVVRRLDAAGPAEDIPPHAVLRVTAAGGPDLRLQVALRLRRAGSPSYAPTPPVTAISGEAATIDLDGLPVGEHAAVLTIWAAGGEAAAAVIRLPRLRVTRRS